MSFYGKMDASFHIFIESLRLNSFGCGGDFGLLFQLTSHEPGIAASIVICARKKNQKNRYFNLS